MEPEVSIVIPTFNSESFIDETILSIRSQTFENWEVIIVDDASQDATLSRLRGLVRDDPRFIVEAFQENQGPARARNFAIERARGRYIAFIDSDDRWLPQKLERQLQFMKDTSAAFSFTSYKFMNSTGVRQQIFHVPRSVSYQDILKSCPISCITIIYDRIKLGKVFMPDIRKRQDYGLCLRLLKITPEAYGLDEALSEVRIRPGSVSFNKWKAAKYQWRVYRELEKLSLPYAIYNFLHYAYRGLNKYGWKRLGAFFGRAT